MVVGEGGPLPPQMELAYSRLLSFDIGRAQSDASDDAQQQQEEAAGASPPHGYDVLVRVICAKNLVGNDWWNGLSDPYVVVTLTSPDGGSQIQYKTRTAFRDLNPHYDEFFEVGNLPAAAGQSQGQSAAGAAGAAGGGTAGQGAGAAGAGGAAGAAGAGQGARLGAEVWDKDLVTPDDVIGAAEWVFDPQRLQQQHGRRWVLSGRVPLQLQLQHPRRQSRLAGQLELEVHYRPSQAPGATRMLGPVRFSQQLSPAFGFLMRHWNDDRSLAYATWKVYLCHIECTFGDVRHPWNRAHDKARQIYNSPLMLKGVRSQHAALYATHLGKSRAGVLRDAADFFALFNNGVRGGQRRYFTYSLLPDSLRCSETGATFAADMMSKHAMHAGGAEEVLYAGEFCIMPDAAAPGGHRLVLDNNSGTFAPSAEHLPLMRRLLAANFPAGIAVETVASGDSRLDWYHQQCPSRG